MFALLVLLALGLLLLAASVIVSVMLAVGAVALVVLAIWGLLELLAWISKRRAENSNPNRFRGRLG